MSQARWSTFVVDTIIDSDILVGLRSGANVAFNASGFALNADNLANLASASTSAANLGLGVANNVAFLNVQAGNSGNAGYFRAYPATASNGYFQLLPVNNTNNFPSILSNVAVGQSTTYSFPDPGAAAANILLNKSVQQMQVGAAIVADKGTATTTGGAATLNNQAGVLTTPSLTTAAGSSYVITLTNSQISASSVILLSSQGGTNTTLTTKFVVAPGAGSATITVYNTGTVTAFNGTLIIGFQVV
jgi:hypothetical protein